MFSECLTDTWVRLSNAAGGRAIQWNWFLQQWQDGTSEQSIIEAAKRNEDVEKTKQVKKQKPTNESRYSAAYKLGQYNAKKEGYAAIPKYRKSRRGNLEDCAWIDGYLDALSDHYGITFASIFEGLNFKP